jgi:type IV pilus assembly protein PilY1
LYFAEGRYYHKQDDTNTTRKLFGIQEPCYVMDTSTNGYDVLPSCSSEINITNLKNQTSAPAALSAAQTGWYVELDPASSTNMMGAERVISNPTPDTLGAIYFLSFAPTSDICGYGGTTYVWALDYKTGGQVTYTLQGKALVQVSTGEIKEIDMSTAFIVRNNRRTVGFPGIPPAGQGLMVITPPPPMRQYMHIQEQ